MKTNYKYNIFIYILRKIFRLSNHNLVESTKEFAYYTVDQIFGRFNQSICFMKPMMVCLGMIWLNQTNISVDSNKFFSKCTWEKDCLKSKKIFCCHFCNKMLLLSQQKLYFKNLAISTKFGYKFFFLIVGIIISQMKVSLSLLMI